MTFSLWFFLLIYAVFLLLWGGFSLVAIYHMMRFGFFNFTTFITTFVYLVVSFILLYISYYYLSQFDWGMNIEIFQGIFDNWFSF